MPSAPPKSPEDGPPGPDSYSRRERVPGSRRKCAPPAAAACPRCVRVSRVQPGGCLPAASRQIACTRRALSKFLPVENHLAAVAGPHDLESFFEVAISESMCDDGLDIESGLQQNGHLVPGLVHLAAIDTANRQHVENDFAPVDGHFAGRNTQHCDAAAVCHVVQHVTKCRLVARHLE